MHQIDDLLIEAEQSVLGAIFLKPDKIDEILFLEERDFTQARHQGIYKAMRHLHKKEMPIDILTVTETCERFGGVQGVGGVSYLTELASNVPTAENINYYADIIRGKALERRVRDAGVILSEMNISNYESEEEFYSFAERLITDLRPEANDKMASVYERKDKYFEHLKTKAEIIKTGFSAYDKWAEGFWRGDLIVSAGRPSVGKTALMINRAYNIAKQQEGPVLIWSQEMDWQQIVDRMISSLTDISYRSIRTKSLSEKDLHLVDIFMKEFEYLPIFVQDSSGVTVEEIKATAKQFKKKYGKIGCIIVDYLQIMKIPQAKGESRATAIGNVTTESKNIARTMKCPFYMLAQMSRDGDLGNRPMLSQLKESSSIEQDADVVEFLWKDPNDPKSKTGGTIVTQTTAKGRNIGINEFKLLFLNWKQKFQEMDPEELKNILGR